MADAVDLARESPAVDSLHGASKKSSGAPFALGLGSIVLGIVVGLAIPISALERENLGPIGDRLTERVKDVVTDLVARGKSAVTDVVSAAFKP